MAPTHPPSQAVDLHQQLRELMDHLSHVLPAQAPIRDFVHHNTLHGFQHLSFPEALAAAERITGASGYLPEEQFRQYYRQGRINRADLDAVLDEDETLAAATSVAELPSGSVLRRDVYRMALLHPLKPVTPSQLTWQIEEMDALLRFQPDVDISSRTRLLDAAREHGLNDEAAAVGDLWRSCLEVLGLEYDPLHPEEMLDLSAEQAGHMLEQLDTDGDEGDQPLVHRQMRKEAERLLQQLLHRIGEDLTLRGLLLALTGHDILDDLRPHLLRHLSSYLDQGLAAWHSPDRHAGFYTAWRQAALRDPGWWLEEHAGWKDYLQSLPNDPLETISSELRRIGLPRTAWPQYLERLALELPGWSGMFLWRHQHPDYQGMGHIPVAMADYLAVRLVLEHLFAQRLCREQWRIEPSIDLLRWYFRRYRSEFLVRYTLFNTRLPEYLASLAQRLVGAGGQLPYVQWRRAADMIWTWRQSPAADRPLGHSVQRSGWRLFRLAQHLGMTGAELRQIERSSALEEIFGCLDRLTPARSGFLWLQAYENHYRDQLLQGLAANHGRGRWYQRTHRASAQLVFCMDDREEGIRRHLEEIDPHVETLGAAGFFGVPMNWRGLDDTQITPLCPVVVTPAHEVREDAREGQEAALARHAQRRSLRLRLKDLFYQETRRNLLGSTLLIALAAPATLGILAGKLLAPLRFGRLVQGLRERFDPAVPTAVAITAEAGAPAATPQAPRLGFTDGEQADRVQNFLRSIGLQRDFAPLVVMMGHGSGSQNNPHLSAYDCGACSGRHGGPNARVFAAMANRPQVRALLRERGIAIPEDTWFLGAEHNTCDEIILWYDLDQVPAALAASLQQLRANLDAATHRSAHERCRRFASAPAAPTPERALRHVQGRAFDFSQARPELGHATNAAAFIGRRAISQGAFFDRRVYLISYDPTQDPEGKVLEAILLAAGPVGAGISLEYYFSTVNNDHYGCGSKITHNITGLFGVMEGTSSDLRTGLPRQMIEVHEAMRLQIVVEASTEVLTAIYLRQPPLQELVGNGWVLLAAKDPDSGAIHLFRPGAGFVPWSGGTDALTTVPNSRAWYSGHSGPLSPALIDPAAEVAHA